MRAVLTLVFFVVINCVLAKNNVKSLTESMGQEVIEIGTPIKAELPPDIEEEPSAEVDEEDKPTTAAPPPVATKRDSKKTGSLTTADTRRKAKEDKSTTAKDDEEARIEKELAEIYKDAVDYKAESSEESEEFKPKKNEIEKPILRSKSKTFQFQPDLNNKAEVERFRTSVDQISCENKDRMKGETTPMPASAVKTSTYLLLCVIPFASLLVFN